MFTDMIRGLARGEFPDSILLRKQFDIAMIKKLAVVKLPPAFWTEDPKINPRADQLLMVALLLADREAVDLVRSVITAELFERRKGSASEQHHEEGRFVCACGQNLIDLLHEGGQEKVRQQVGMLLHDMQVLQ